MKQPESAFRETGADPRTESVPFSHLSLELGHLYMEDFLEGPDRLRRHFRTVRPWAEAARAGVGPLPADRRPRISTCFLIDDYFSRLSTPAALIPPLVESAAEAGLTIDYLALESGCASPGPGRQDRAALAESVLHRLVESPPPGSQGFRPPVSRTGWLSNGSRAPARRTSAALDPTGSVWQPPSETGARGHSVFLDVELWNGPEEERTWSCAFLASVWQLVRLGLLRDRGRAVLTPTPWDGREFPAEWDALPPLLRLNPRAAPFTAYATCSVLPARFLAVEHAVRVILEQVLVDADALGQVAERSAAEGFAMHPEPVERTSYMFPSGL
ncbi:MULTISPECIES: SCO2522 family protein [unclassified Streptomyces]|uniref:SCO2522 family protein n=1 Tax=unclassified Streptomyces TaxID=2593676 RepID=UPI0029BBF775|nr:SCO2522 family protein [Streptomyces sp. FL07-04A]MDX3576815.1 SCO2522 family protein [Streptomyces sp. FL07-04A]